MTKRADLRLLELGLARSRTAAQRLIKAGSVHTEDGRRVQAPSDQVEVDARLKIDPSDEVAKALTRFVSRGGLKLWAALDRVGIAKPGKALDIGQSTGGFTDALLQRGSPMVVGVDVGHGQLDQRLRADQRVVCLEGVNARMFAKPEVDQITEHTKASFDLIVADLSFISLTYIFPGVLTLLADGASLLALVKPQFELTASDLDKRGVVKASQADRLYRQVEEKIRQAVVSSGGRVEDYFASSILGSDGNREFFVHARRLPEPTGSH